MALDSAEPPPGAEQSSTPAAHEDQPADPTVEIPAQGAAGAPDDVDSRALRKVDFASVWRGYDTQAVDAYVALVARSISALERNRSPTEAVRQALDRVGEQTATILREAERTAAEMTAASRKEADERLGAAELEATAIRAKAEARAEELDGDIERLWQERQRLIDATKQLADRLRGVADDAEARFPPEDGEPQRPRQ